jgi:hypothetical protein
MQLFKQNYVKYGLMLCAVLVICLTLMELSGNNETFDNKSPIFLVYQFVAPAVIFYFGLKSKKKLLGGKLTFKQGLKESFKMSLVFGIVSAFIFMLYYLVINPGILDYVRTAYNLVDAPDSTVIITDMVTQVIAASIFGTIYGMVITLFLKTKS